MSTSTQTDHSVLLEQTKQLEELGFNCSKKILKLLIRTNGNFEVVKNFLVAKKKLKESSGKRKIPHTSPVQITISPENAIPDPSVLLPPLSEASPSTILPKELQSKEDRVTEKLRRKTAKYQLKQLKFLDSHENKFKKERREKKEKRDKEERKREKKDRKDLKHRNKDLNRSEKKCRKSENRWRHEKKPINPQELFQNWPAAIDHLYLDGNNMMYVCAPIRVFCLSQSTAKAEQALAFLAKSFSSAIGVKCTLIFDDTKTTSTCEDFIVRSARPSFKTSDDALVHDLQNKKPISNGSSLYVTSDRELGERLTKAGGVIYRPKEWFYLVAEVLSGKVKSPEELDSWIAEFIKPLL